MLLRASASNYLSIASRQELSLIATKLKGPEIAFLDVAGSPGLRALPSAVLYGANASGKTNFVKALRFMRSAILRSHSHDPESGVPRAVFGLDDNAVSKPTHLEADFVVGKVQFQYGFECNDERFTSEWLYSFPEGKRRKLFERDGQDVEFGQSFRGPKKILVDLMRPNSLFVSTATQNDHEELTSIVSFFRQSVFTNAISVDRGLINNTFRKDQIDSRTIGFLKAIGTGIVKYHQKDVDIPENIKMFQRELVTLARKHMGEGFLEDTESDRDKRVKIEFAHSGVDGQEYYFGVERESSGTRRLIIVMNAVFKAIDRGSLVVIDELDASLHTLATEKILEIFSDPQINTKGAQLIATTHDTNLLASKYLRRDQIWFCEKTPSGASEMFPLSDIKARQTDNFQQGYLEGRYGAIPFSGDMMNLFRAS